MTQFRLTDREEFSELLAKTTVGMLHEMVYECNDFDLSLEDYKMRAFDNEFLRTFFDKDIMGAVRATVYGSVNFLDDYVRFDNYGNLETFNDAEYDILLQDNKEEIVETALEHYENGNVRFSLDIEVLFDSYLESVED